MMLSISKSYVQVRTVNQLCVLIYLVVCLTAFKLWPHILGMKNNPFFLWGVSPSKNGLMPPY